MDKFFQIASKVVIAFPILIIIMAFFLWNPSGSTKPPLLDPTPTFEPTPTVAFDINGSFVCRFTTPNNSTSEAYIKNKAMYMKQIEKTGEEYLLFQKDCLYEWSASQSAGIKTCGLGQYVGLFESLSSAGLVKPDDFLTRFLGSDKLVDSTGKQIKFTDSCKEQVIRETKMFEVPEEIRFVEKEKK